MYFIFSIDTEEDQWDTYREKPSVKNIYCIRDFFHGLCQKYGIRPTYLVDTPVIDDPSSQNIIRELIKANDCEIGMHLHPWGSAPHLPKYQFPKHTHITNYPSELIGEKIKKLFHEIQNTTQQPCKTFRAGRWSMSKDAMEHLFRLGINIDSSVTPYSSWEMYGGNNYSDSSMQSYKFLVPDYLEPNQSGNAYEVPPSIGWTKGNLDTMHALEKMIVRAPNCLKIKGLLHHFHLLRKVWLSPEQTTTKDMINLSQNLLRQKHSYIHAMIHSNSLLADSTPYTLNESDVKSLYERIEALFQYVKEKQLKPVTISEFVEQHYQPGLPKHET